jgi:hypothetical protein
MTHPFYKERVMYWPYGWHGTATGEFKGISEYIKASRAKGAGVNFLSTDAAGIIAGEILPIQSNDAVAFRFTSIPGVGDVDRLPVENGRYVGNPIDAFNRNYDLTHQYYPPELLDNRHLIYSTYVNEPNTYQGNNEANEHDIEYLATGFLHLAQRSIEDNRRYAFAGWAGGNPHEDFWYHPKVEQLFRLAVEHPHLIACNGHLYSLDNGSLLTNFEYMVGRYRQMYKAYKYYGLPPMFWVGGEAGWGEDDMSCSNEEAIRQMSIVQDRFIEDRFWGSWMGWTLGKWGGQIVQKMIRLSPDNTEMVKTYQPVTIPAIGEPPMGNYKSVVVKIAQEHTKLEWQQIAAIAFDDFKRTLTASHNNAGVMALDGNDESYIKVVDPSLPSQVSSIKYFEDLGIRWEPVLLRDDDQQWKILNIPHMSQRGAGAEARYNDCGAAAVAMVVNGQTPNSPTVNEVAIKYQNPPNEYMNFSQLDAALNGYDMNGIWKRPYFADGISETIHNGQPVIALVWYQSLPYQFDTFDGSHFITCYGTNGEDTILYRDPLAHDDTPLPITFDELDKTMRDVTQQGNNPSQGMICIVDDAPPTQPPTGKTYDLLHYLKGDGRLYEVKNASGGQERFQTQSNGSTFDQTKNSLAERLYVDGDFIYRGIDISPGGNRFYVQQEPKGNDRARWMPRDVAIGEAFTVSLYVQFYNWDCSESSANTGGVTDTRTLREHYDTWESRAGITLQDVIRITWDNGGETYFYARGFGLVGWERTHQDPNTPQWSAISEIHEPGQRPDNVVNWPSC